MAIQRYKPEQIVTLLRQIEVGDRQRGNAARSGSPHRPWLGTHNGLSRNMYSPLGASVLAICAVRHSEQVVRSLHVHGAKNSGH